MKPPNLLTALNQYIVLSMQLENIYLDLGVNETSHFGVHFSDNFNEYMAALDNAIIALEQSVEQLEVITAYVHKRLKVVSFDTLLTPITQEHNEESGGLSYVRILEGLELLKPYINIGLNELEDLCYSDNINIDGSDLKILTTEVEVLIKITRDAFRVIKRIIRYFHHVIPLMYKCKLTAAELKITNNFYHFDKGVIYHGYITEENENQ